MNGKFEPSETTDQQCSHCGLYFDDRGIKAHQMHCPFQGKPYRVLPDDGSGGGAPDSGGDPPDDGSPPTRDESPDGTHGGVSDGSPPEAPDIGDSTGSGAPPTDHVVTDGSGLGLGGPPSSTGSTGGARSPADLPDRYVDVDDWLGAVREQGDQVTVGDQVVDVDVLEEQLSEFDVVDVEETSSEEIVAYPLDEVPA